MELDLDDDERYFKFLLDDPLTDGDVQGFAQRFRARFGLEVQVILGPGLTDGREWSWVLALPRSDAGLRMGYWDVCWWSPESVRYGGTQSWPPADWVQLDRQDGV